MTSGDLVWATEVREAVWIAAPAGRVDEATATEFAERLVAEIGHAAGRGASRLAIDLSEIEYMSSRGLRGLTLAERKSGEHGVAIVLVSPNDIMREILAISRYDKVFPIFDTIEQVLTA
jgi:anti-anti-sigma factor